MTNSRFPLSGNVSQTINPWSWWLNPMGQFGLINVNQMSSANPQLEREIVENVAGYGRQLGRIMEAFDVLLQRADLTGLTAKQTKAVAEYREMAARIEAVKAGLKIPSAADVDKFVEGLRYLKERDRAAYEALVEKVRRELPASQSKRR